MQMECSKLSPINLPELIIKRLVLMTKSEVNVRRLPKVTLIGIAKAHAVFYPKQNGELRLPPHL